MKLGLMRRLDLSLKWAAIPWTSDDKDAAYFMMHIDAPVAALLIRGVNVDVAWMQIEPRGDGSWDLHTKPAAEMPPEIQEIMGRQPGKPIEVHYRDQKFVQKIMFAAYDLLATVEEADKALLPDEVAASARRFKKTLKKARKQMERGEDPA